MKPTNVAILEKPGHVSAGKEIKVVCQSLGGYPHPKLTWWLGTKMLKSNEEVSTIKAGFPTLTILQGDPNQNLKFLLAAAL